MSLAAPSSCREVLSTLKVQSIEAFNYLKLAKITAILVRQSRAVIRLSGLATGFPRVAACWLDRITFVDGGVLETTMALSPLTR